VHFITNWQSRSREFYDTKVLLLKIKTKKRVKVKTLRGPDSHSRSRFSELGRALSANGIARFGDALFRFRSLLRARRSSPPIGRRSCERTRSVTWTRGKNQRQLTAPPCVPSMDPAPLERRRRDRQSARQPRRGALAGKRRRRGVARGAPCRKVESQA